MPDEQPTDKQLVLDTLGFLFRERNKALLQLNHFRLQRKEAARREGNALHRVRYLKSRLQAELETHFDLLKNDERKQFDADGSDDSN